MGRTMPRWRSVLFVPATATRLIERAQTRGADALQLDLEDALPAAARDAARGALPEIIASLAQGPADLLVRINRPWRHAVRDLEAVARPGVSAVTLPKTETPADVAVVSEILDELESERGLPPGGIGVIAQVESAAGLRAMMLAPTFPARLCGITVGPEDYTLDLGVEPTHEALLQPLKDSIAIARAAGVPALGFARTIGDFKDLDALAAAVAEAYRLGARGAFCVHPAQVPVLNAGYQPGAAAAANARAVVAAFDEAMARGSGVAKLDGAMIDRPVYERARRLLADVHDADASAEPSP